MSAINMNFASPRLMLVAGGAVKQIAEVLAKFGLSRPLVVTDPFMVSLRPCAALPRTRWPRPASPVTVFSDTVPDPTDTVIEAGVAELRKGDFDCLIGFGGGSPIDTAKAMAILAAGGGKMRDYKVPFAADKGAVPVIAIPTTAGTGSECTRFTVITDTERDEKMLIAGLGALPLAAHRGLRTDLLRAAAHHGRYRRRQPDPCAGGVRLEAGQSVLRRAGAVGDGPDRPATSAPPTPNRATPPRARRMMIGATQAGLAFSNSSVALVHGMSRPIGAHFHVPHGLSNAMLLPAITRFSVGGAEARYAEASRRIGFAERQATAMRSAAAKLVTGLEALNKDLSVPTPAEYGIKEADWNGKMALMAEQALASGSPGNNPRVPTRRRSSRCIGRSGSGRRPIASVMTGGGIAGGLNHAIKQTPGAGWLSESDVILL